MFRVLGGLLAPKTLQNMLRKLKLAGAHPDVIWSIDAVKAQQNGEAMIRLETLMHQRSSSPHDAVAKSNGPQEFSFWLLKNAGDGKRSNALVNVSTVVNPAADNSIVKEQLAKLFRGAGVMEDFDVTSTTVEADLDSVLRSADQQMDVHLEQTSPLYLRGDKSIETLRRYGILVVVAEGERSYLVTLPENELSHLEQGATKAIRGPGGPVDKEMQDFLNDRGLLPFDLRLAGSYSAVERFVTGFELLERSYHQHRGLAMRSGVCIVVSLDATGHYVAGDGAIILAARRMSSWEEFMLSILQDQWKTCVQQQLQWRVDGAPKLQEHREKLRRIASMFHFFSVDIELRIGMLEDWQGELVGRFLKDEGMIRNAVKKYKLESSFLKGRGTIVFEDKLVSAVDGKEIQYRIRGDGKLMFSRRATTAQMLKVLKDNLKIIESIHKDYTSHIAVLEHLSRSMPIDFSIDSEWRKSQESNLGNCISTFTKTMKTNQDALKGFLASLSKDAGAVKDGGRVVPLTADQEERRQQLNKQARRMLWIVSDRFRIMPSGIVFVPWNVDFESIKRMLLSQGS